MSKISETLKEFAGENRELLITISLNALIKAVTIALPKAVDETKDLLELASEAVRVLSNNDAVTIDDMKKQWQDQDDAVSHILAIARASDGQQG